MSYKGVIMEFIPVRDFRLKPGKIWQKLKKSKKILITSNGKPIALLKDMTGRDIEEEIRADAVSRGIIALSKIRDHSRRKKLNTLSDKEIDLEIKNTRKTR